VKDKMKVGYLITGRLKSTRLPKKLLLEIKGKSVLSHMLDRLKLAKNVDEIIICTSTKDQDIPLGELAKENNVKCFFGSPDDVLKRLLGAANKFNLDYILNITADCPFADPFYADKIVEEYLKTDADLIRQFDLPHGAFSYGIKVEALKKVLTIKDSSDTEVWGRYFTDTGLFNVIDLDVLNEKHKKPGLRMTLDYPEDFAFFKTVFDELYVEGKVFTLTQILELLEKKPEIIKLNASIGRKFKKRYIAQSEPMLKKTNKIEKALIIGAGSIGQRHIKNLKKKGVNNIVALRSKKGHFKKLPIEFQLVEVDSWKKAIALKPDIAIIANPSSYHVESAIKICDNVKGIFIEKPISNSSDSCKRLIEILNEKKVVSFVGHNMMFHPSIDKIIKFHDNNDVGSIINIQCQAGQWLPDWHPYEDYKNAYYARKDLGGGVSLTLIHEIHLALELAGLPISVYGEISEYNQLDVDVDVCSDLMIKHNTGAVSQIHLDYLQRPSHRSGLVTFEKGWVSYDFRKMELIGQIKGGDVFRIWSNLDHDFNEVYEDQLDKFLRFVEEGRLKHQYDANSAIESVKVVEAFIQSNSSGKKVYMERNERFSF
jgi:spore coat polysaccharide biosynthesis protein SpsF